MLFQLRVFWENWEKQRNQSPQASAKKETNYSGPNVCLTWPRGEWVLTLGALMPHSIQSVQLPVWREWIWKASIGSGKRRARIGHWYSGREWGDLESLPRSATKGLHGLSSSFTCLSFSCPNDFMTFETPFITQHKTVWFLILLRSLLSANEQCKLKY